MMDCNYQLFSRMVNLQINQYKLQSNINSNIHMKEKDELRLILQKAKSIRQKSRTSCVELQNFLFYQYLSLQKGSPLLSCTLCARPKTETKKQFRRAFKTLSKKQQAEYYLMNVKNVQKFLNTRVKKVGDQTQVLDETPPNGQVIKMQLQIKDDKIYKTFTQVNVEIITRQKIIKIEGVKQQIDLHCYIVRKSRGKIKNCIVLESTQTFSFSDTIRLCFSGIDFQDSYNLIHKTWEESQYENIKKILIEDNKFPRRIEGHRLNTMKSILQFQDQDVQPITTKMQKKQNFLDSIKLSDTINRRNEKQISNLSKSANLVKIQNTLISQQLMHSLNSYASYTQQNFNTFYHKDGMKVRKIFQFSDQETTIEMICSAIDEIKGMRKRKTTIVDIKHLNSIPSERTNVYRQVDNLDGHQIQFVYFRHFFNKQGNSYYIQKSVDLEEFSKNGNNRGIIRHCLWRVKKNNEKIQVMADADIEYSRKVKNPQKLTSLYIGQFKDYIKKQIEDSKKTVTNIEQISIATDEFENQYLSEISNEDQEFFTVAGSVQSNQEQVLEEVNHQNGYSYLNDKVEKMGMKKKPINTATENQPFQKLIEDDTNKQTATQPSQPAEYYLKHKYQLVANKKDSPIYIREPEGHILWGTEWKISETGELINLDHQKIKMQSSVLKLVLTRMGKNLFSGKSIMNMSLPIQIFGTDSNIQRIARGFIYAPIFIQKAQAQNNPVARMKYVFCFALGFSVSYIRMQKPFNPVIGETYQGVIDGCPVYGEQISHHPPISSMLFMGRGFRAYGFFQAKIQMGINSASGLNEGFNNIQFYRDKSIVKFNTPPGEMVGVIFGQRKLTLTKKSCFIDKNNYLFCEISWGKQSSNPRPDSKYNDFFSGKIVKLKHETNMQDYKKIKQKDVQMEYGEIHGRFTGKVYYEDELIFDVNGDAPMAIQDYSPCLQSDSRLRKDIIERKKKNYQSAQDAKQEIEQLQRHDRKLRKHDS